MGKNDRIEQALKFIDDRFSSMDGRQTIDDGHIQETMGVFFGMTEAIPKSEWDDFFSDTDFDLGGRKSYAKIYTYMLLYDDRGDEEILLKALDETIKGCLKREEKNFIYSQITGKIFREGIRVSKETRLMLDELYRDVVDMFLRDIDIPARKPDISERNKGFVLILTRQLLEILLVPA